jgi:hypothetical protein
MHSSRSPDTQRYDGHQLGDEVARYGPDLFGTLYVLTLGLASLFGFPALGISTYIKEKHWGFLAGFLVPTLLMGVPFTYFGLKMFRTRCILYREGFTVRKYWSTQTIWFEQVEGVRLFIGSRGAAQMCITIDGGRDLWFTNISNIRDAAERIARSARVSLQRG